MQVLQTENTLSLNVHALVKTSQPSKAINLNEQQSDNSVYSQVLLLGNYYTFKKNDVNNEQKTIGFILLQDLINFLLWVHQPIVDVFGNVEKNLHISKCWDETDYHLVLTVYSSSEDMDELTRLEKQLFEKLNSYPEIDHALSHVVIAQR